MCKVLDVVKDQRHELERRSKELYMLVWLGASANKTRVMYV